MRNFDKLLELAKRNNGVIQTKMLREYGIPRDYLSYAVKEGILERVYAGIYITKDTIEDFPYYLQLKIKNLVYSYETSAYYNGLTTRTPLVYNATVTSDSNVSRLRDYKIGIKLNVHFVRRSKFDIGITYVKTMLGNEIMIYDKERTICDLFSKTYTGDRFIANESLKTYLRMRDRNLNKLMNYAKELNVDEILREKLEILLWKHQDN